MDLYSLLRRIRKIVGVDGNMPFLGTDFTYSDMGLVRLPRQCEGIEATDHLGVQAYRVAEEVPREAGSYYSRIVTWLAADSFLPLQRDCYDTAGNLWKTQFWKDIAKIGDIPTPLLIQMKDLQRGFVTELKISHVTYDERIPDDIFDLNQLPEVVNSPFWKRQGIEAGQGE